MAGAFEPRRKYTGSFFFFFFAGIGDGGWSVVKRGATGSRGRRGEKRVSRMEKRKEGEKGTDAIPCFSSKVGGEGRRRRKRKR